MSNSAKPSPHKGDRCETCQFFEKTPVGQDGRCHRNPPADGFPVSHTYSWCGEFKKDPDFKEKPELVAPVKK